MFSAATSQGNHRIRIGAVQTFSLAVALPLSVLRVWFTALVLLTFATAASATSIKLAWDPVSDPDLAGYKLYYGYASRQYNTHVNAGENTTAALSGLKDAKM